MRIALLTYSTKPRGGVVHTLSLAEALAAQGESVTVVTLGRGGDRAFFREVDPAVELEVIPFTEPIRPETVGERVIRSIAILSAAFDPDRFDVVHAQDCITANAVPGAIRTVHHLDSFTTEELARCHERGIVCAASHVCVSDGVAAELANGWGISATVIPNGVDFRRFEAAAADTPVASDARRRWASEVGAPYVLTVGGIEPRKGSLDLAEAFARARLLGLPPHVRLVVAGGETLFDYRAYREAFGDRCTELGIDPIVLGPVAHDDLPALVAGAAVFAFPSLKEGFGLAALEAAAAGVPLVVRDLPVLKDLLPGAAAFAADPTSLGFAIHEAFESPDRTALARARAVAASFSWELAALAHRQLYAEMLDTAGRP